MEHAKHAGHRQPPMPVTILAGMPVVEASDGTSGTVLGITEACCVYRVDSTGSVAVSPWHNMALSNICPASPLLPSDTTERDRRNASVGVLRELLALRQLGLTETQQAAIDELIRELCPGSDYLLSTPSTKEK